MIHQNNIVKKIVLLTVCFMSLTHRLQGNDGEEQKLDVWEKGAGTVFGFLIAAVGHGVYKLYSFASEKVDLADSLGVEVSLVDDAFRVYGRFAEEKNMLCAFKTDQERARLQQRLEKDLRCKLIGLTNPWHVSCESKEHLQEFLLARFKKECEAVRKTCKTE